VCSENAILGGFVSQLDLTEYLPMNLMAHVRIHHRFFGSVLARSGVTSIFTKLGPGSEREKPNRDE
jgi:hypothetical protein